MAAKRLRLTAAGYYLIFGLLYLTGMAAGIYLLQAETPFLSGFLRSAVRTGLSGITERRLQDCFLLFALPGLGNMLLLYLWGMWGAALPFTLTLFPLHGFGAGLTAAWLLSVCGGKGLWCYLLLFFPFQFLGVCLTFLAGKESMRLSRLLLRCLAEGTGEGKLRPVFGAYTRRMLLLTAAVTALILLQTFAVFCFGGSLLQPLS